MGTVTSVTMFCSNLDYETDDNDKPVGGLMVSFLDRIRRELGFNGTLNEVSHAGGGGNCGGPMFHGGFKIGDHEALIKTFMEAPWQMPEFALLIIQTEDSPFCIYSPVCKMVTMIGGEFPAHLMREQYV